MNPSIGVNSASMIWYNTEHEMPEDGVKYLISVKGVYHVATFVKSMKGFKLHDGGFFLLTEGPVYWTIINTPKDR